MPKNTYQYDIGLGDIGDDMQKIAMMMMERRENKLEGEALVSDIDSREYDDPVITDYLDAANSVAPRNPKAAKELLIKGLDYAAEKTLAEPNRLLKSSQSNYYQYRAQKEKVDIAKLVSDMERKKKQTELTNEFITNLDENALMAGPEGAMMSTAVAKALSEGDLTSLEKAQTERFKQKKAGERARMLAFFRAEAKEKDDVVKIWQETNDVAFQQNKIRGDQIKRLEKSIAERSEDSAILKNKALNTPEEHQQYLEGIQATKMQLQKLKRQQAESSYIMYKNAMDIKKAKKYPVGKEDVKMLMLMEWVKKTLETEEYDAAVKKIGDKIRKANERGDISSTMLFDYLLETE